MAMTMTSSNSPLDTPLTFWLLMKPNNGLFLAAFWGAPCVSLTLTIFLLVVPIGMSFDAENMLIIAPRKILRPPFLPLLSLSVRSLSAAFRVFLSGDSPPFEDRFFFGRLPWRVLSALLVNEST